MANRNCANCKHHGLILHAYDERGKYNWCFCNLELHEQPREQHRADTINDCEKFKEAT